jgi:hypothetical protein
MTARLFKKRQRSSLFVTVYDYWAQGQFENAPKCYKMSWVMKRLHNGKKKGSAEMRTARWWR